MDSYEIYVKHKSKVRSDPSSRSYDYLMFYILYTCDIYLFDLSLSLSFQPDEALP